MKVFQMTGRVLNEGNKSNSGKALFINVASKKEYYEDKTSGEDDIFNVMVVGNAIGFFEKRRVGDLLLFTGDLTIHEEEVPGEKYKKRNTILSCNKVEALAYSQKNQTQQQQPSAAPQQPQAQASQQPQRPAQQQNYQQQPQQQQQQNYQQQQKPQAPETMPDIDFEDSGFDNW